MNSETRRNPKTKEKTRLCCVKPKKRPLQKTSKVLKRYRKWISTKRRIVVFGPKTALSAEDGVTICRNFPSLLKQDQVRNQSVRSKPSVILIFGVNRPVTIYRPAVPGPRSLPADLKKKDGSKRTVQEIKKHFRLVGHRYFRAGRTQPKLIC